jgi:hypothetical protein
LYETEGHTLFVYADGTRVVVRSDGRAVWAVWPSSLTLEDTSAYLLGPIMAFVLRLHGRLALHAGVFATAGGAFALAGGPGAGKSTLVAALALAGVPVLSDDVAPLVERGDRFLVSASHPLVRLWDDSVALLLGEPRSLPLLTPNWDKRFLDLSERRAFEPGPLPLQAIFVLAQDRAGREPGVEALTPRAAFVAVLEHLHSVWMLPAKPQREIFALAARLARRIPAYRLVPDRDPLRSAELCRRLAAAVVEGGGATADAKEAHVRAG